MILSNKLNKYRISAVLKVETDIIISIAVSHIGLVIMSITKLMYLFHIEYLQF
jgi:hypothetical protein